MNTDSCLTINCLVNASLCGPTGHCTVHTLANSIDEKQPTVRSKMLVGRLNIPRY